jgi:chromate transporter
MLWDLFLSFLKMGCISFGGGYAMIPVIENEVVAHHWMTEADFSRVVSLAGMAPGPVATNAATIVGYKTGGLPGAVAASAATLLPSLAMILAIAYIIYRFRHLRLFEAVFYGLRPIITGLIIYAAIHFGAMNGIVPSFQLPILIAVVLVLLSLVALMKYRVHPLLVIFLAGVVGAVCYT